MGCIFPDGSAVTLDSIGTVANSPNASGGWSAVTQAPISVGGFQRSRAVADVTPINQGPIIGGGVSYKKKKASRRVDHQAIKITYYFDPTAATGALPAFNETPVTLTITFPDGSKKLVGEGYVVATNAPGEMVSDDVVKGEFDFQFEGGANGSGVPVIS